MGTYLDILLRHKYVGIHWLFTSISCLSMGSEGITSNMAAISWLPVVERLGDLLNKWLGGGF